MSRFISSIAVNLKLFSVSNSKIFCLFVIRLRAFWVFYKKKPTFLANNLRTGVDPPPFTDMSVKSRCFLTPSRSFIILYVHLPHQYATKRKAEDAKRDLLRIFLNKSWGWLRVSILHNLCNSAKNSELMFNITSQQRMETLNLTPPKPYRPTLC